VACRSGHGIGKTFLLGALASWFLHAFEPSIVITTAPGRSQIQTGIWKELRSQYRSSIVKLHPGLLPKEPKWEISADHYARGISTDTGERLKGTHSPNMLIIIDEGTGVPLYFIDEAENMCTAPNNKILTVGNPTCPTGWFVDCFSPKSNWTKHKISSLDHPNVIQNRQVFPGAVSRGWAEERIRKYCISIDKEEVDPVKYDFEFPKQSGKWYRPNTVFQSRVLGEIPSDGPDQLITSSQVAYARTVEQPIDETLPVDIGVDVARKGMDYTVIYVRQGPCVIKRLKWQGKDLAQTTGRVMNLIKGYMRQGIHVRTVAVDAIGVGAGVADNLRDANDTGEIDCNQVLAVQVSESATNTDLYLLRRDELGFMLSDRFKDHSVDLTRLGEEADDFESDAIQIMTDYTVKGRQIVESKDKFRDRTGHSPDDFDAMALAFINTVDTFAENYAMVMSAG
jgi:nuclear transport factor 2 (NTF2) superfamily protein